MGGYLDVICKTKTSNSIICDSKYELYVCKKCILSKSFYDEKLIQNCSKYCREVAREKLILFRYNK